MNKRPIVLAISIAILALGAYFIYQKSHTSATPVDSETNSAPALPSEAKPLENLTFTVDDTPYQLKNGVFEGIAPQATTPSTVRMFGKPYFGDLNGDGQDDAIVFLAEDSGGSGTFVYAAAAIKEKNQYVGKNSVLLGDRIDPTQATFIGDQKVRIDYKDHAPAEGLANPPSVPTSMTLQWKENQLINYAQAVAQTMGQGVVDRVTREYRCAKGKTLSVEYDNSKNGGEFVTISLNKNEQPIVLKPAIAASGAKYENEQLSWWVKDTGSLEKNSDNTAMYSDCVAKKTYSSTNFYDGNGEIDNTLPWDLTIFRMDPNGTSPQSKVRLSLDGGGRTIWGQLTMMQTADVSGSITNLNGEMIEGDKKYPTQISITKGDCKSSNQSDTTHYLSNVTIQLENQSLKGCGNFIADKP